MTAMRLKRYPSPSGGFALGKMGVGATMLKQGKTARDYVQSGLVAMWDGIENAGWGAHDASATTWKDLTGNGHDIAISTATFSDDAINISERSAALTHGFSTGSIRAIEISVKERLSGYCILFFDTRNRITHYFENGVNGMQFNPDRANSAVVKSGASTFAATMDADGMLQSGYADGRPNPISNWTRWSGGENYYLSPRYGSWTFAGSLRFIRIYDRMPTADEFAANYAIDKERFNLP